MEALYYAFFILRMVKKKLTQKKICAVYRESARNDQMCQK